MRIAFDKMEGAGNDFILIDNRDGSVPDDVKVGLVTEWCHRRFGVGADGVIFVETDLELDFRWDFYNSDGSRAEMCGNGARCVARFARKIGAARDSMSFRSLAGPITASLSQRGAKVKLTDCQLPAGLERVDIGETAVDLWFLNSGVPHAVVQVDDLDRVDVSGLGRAIRHHPRFAPAGTNVNFFHLDGEDSLSIRTYERGVEDETLACGTGSVATGIVAATFLRRRLPVRVRTRGGELAIHFTCEGGMARDVYLEGPARLVFEGELAF